MADIRIKDLATTASSTAADDFLAVDGTTNGTRKLSAATPSFATSVTVPGVASPAATNLTLGTGTYGTALTFASSTGAATFAGAVTATGLTLNLSSGFGSTILAGITGYNNFTLNGSNSLTTGMGMYGGASGDAALYINAPATGNVYFRIGGSDKVAIKSSGNLLVGGNTDIAGSGGLKVFGTTPSTGADSGALQVAGGIYAGAASVFGGAVTTGVAKAGTGVAGYAEFSNAAFFGTTDYALTQNSSGATLLNAALGQDVTIRSNRNVLAATFSNGAATFAGAVAINNTVATGVAVASTHKVTMVIGGVTYYLLASNV